MAQEFRIRKDSTLPTLRMELIDDGKYDFAKDYVFNNAIQNADIFFSMKDENDKLKISKKKANLFKINESSCEERFIIGYKWDERDTNKEGKYEGWFDIYFNDDITEDGIEYPSGHLKMPIHETLNIYIK